MAKKFGKFLLFTAAIGAAAAGTYYYLQNKNQKPVGEDDEYDDLDDFDSDFDEDDEEERSYVSLNLEDNKDKVEEFFNDDSEADDKKASENKKSGEDDDDDDPDPSLDAV